MNLMWWPYYRKADIKFIGIIDDFVCSGKLYVLTERLTNYYGGNYHVDFTS